MHGEFGVFLGLDVGKEGHHAVGLAPDGRRLHDGVLPNTDAGADAGTHVKGAAQLIAALPPLLADQQRFRFNGESSGK